jgi:hypothetical protein
VQKVQYSFIDMTVASELNEKTCVLIYNREFNRIVKFPQNVWNVPDQTVDQAIVQNTKFMNFQFKKLRGLLISMGTDPTDQMN